MPHTPPKKPQDFSWVRDVVRAGRESGVDPTTLLTTALIESGGNPRAVGDNGSSFGLFQLHQGGRLTAAGLTPEQAYDPYTNASASAREFRTFADKGLKGAELAYAAQRPADRTGYINRYNQTQEQARRLLAQYGGSADSGTPTPGRPAQSPTRQVSPAVTQQLPPEVDLDEATLRGQFEALVGRGKVRTIDILTGGMRARDEASAANAQRAADLARIAKDKQQETEPVSPAEPTATGGANPPAPNSQGVSRATSWALNNLGVPYSWGGGTPSGPTRGIAQGAGTTGWDCSAFVQAALAQAGVKLSRTTYTQIKEGQPVASLAQAQPGDLIFPSAGHVGLYLGNGRMAEAPYTGAVTRVKNIVGMKPIAIRRVL